MSAQALWGLEFWTKSSTSKCSVASEHTARHMAQLTANSEQRTRTSLSRARAGAMCAPPEGQVWTAGESCLSQCCVSCSALGDICDWVKTEVFNLLQIYHSFFHSLASSFFQWLRWTKQESVSQVLLICPFMSRTILVSIILSLTVCVSKTYK